MAVNPCENKKSLYMFDNSLLFWQYEDKEFCLRVLVDESPANPRDDCCLATMACFHSRYILGDKIDAKTPGEFWDDLITKHISNSDLASVLQHEETAQFEKYMEEEGVGWDDHTSVADLIRCYDD